MAVFIIAQRDQNDRLIKNLGVAQTRSSGHAFIQRLRTANPNLLVGGRYAFSTADDLRLREQELDYNPSIMILYENEFYKVYAEKSELY